MVTFFWTHWNPCPKSITLVHPTVYARLRRKSCSYGGGGVKNKINNIKKYTTCVPAVIRPSEWRRRTGKKLNSGTGGELYTPVGWWGRAGWREEEKGVWVCVETGNFFYVLLSSVTPSRPLPQSSLPTHTAPSNPSYIHPPPPSFASSSFWLQQTSRLQITHGDGGGGGRCDGGDTYGAWAERVRASEHRCRLGANLVVKSARRVFQLQPTLYIYPYRQYTTRHHNNVHEKRATIPEIRRL